MKLLVLAVMSVMLAACGSSTDTADTGVAAGPDAGVAAGADAGATALTCDAYCTRLMANCTAANAQFGGLDQCKNSCKAYPAGAASDTSGNTLGCRYYHAGAAAADPATHCPHAGPAGSGTCGATCDGYCQIAMMYCTAANSAKVYTDLADCKATCGAFPDTVKFSVNNTTLQEQKQAGCLVYHAQEASASPADHCLGDLAKSDAGLPSMTCATP